MADWRVVKLWTVVVVTAAFYLGAFVALVFVLGSLIASLLQ